MILTDSHTLIILESLAEASKWYPLDDPKRKAYEKLYDAFAADVFVDAKAHDDAFAAVAEN